MALLNFQQPVFSFTRRSRPFRNHSNILIWCSNRLTFLINGAEKVESRKLIINRKFQWTAFIWNSSFSTWQRDYDKLKCVYTEQKETRYNYRHPQSSMEDIIQSDINDISFSYVTFI